MPIVFDNVNLPGVGTDYDVGARVVVYLVASEDDSTAPGWNTGYDITFIDKHTKYTNGAGYVEFNLWPNSDLSPVNTYYVWETHLSDGRVNRRTISVPTTPSMIPVNDILIANPGPASGFRPYAASLLRTTSQSIPNNTSTAVSFPSAEYQSGDTPLWVAGQPTRLTAPASGEYLMGGTVRFSANATGDRFSSLLISGAFVVTLDERPGAANPICVSLTAFQYLTAGEYLEMKVVQTSGGALTIDDYGFDDVIRMWMKRVG